MLKRILLVLIFISFILNTIAAQEGGVFSFGVTPGINIPLLSGNTPLEGVRQKFTEGLEGGINGRYILPISPLFYVGADIDYFYLPVVTEDVLNLITLTAVGGINYSFIPQLNLKAYLAAGWGIGFVQERIGNCPVFKVGANLNYMFTPAFGLGLGVSYKYAIGSTFEDPIFDGVGIQLVGTFNLGVKETKKPDIELRQIELLPVFPVFCKYYDEHPLGKIKLFNAENGAITDVKVKFFVKQYMDSPKLCAEYEEIEQGKEIEVPLYALFTDSVLSITEATKVQAEILIEYEFGIYDVEFSQVETLRMYDRNAMTWDDDKKAASFVTAKDPAVLQFSKNTAGIIRNSPLSYINNNFLTAFALFEAEKLYGLNYVVDPKTPFIEFSQKEDALDFLQFPRQTLEYKAGDCDDLSILYCAMLESTGIETAFITVPGHIYAAFNLGVVPGIASQFFDTNENLIFIDDTTWIPVEITIVQQGFVNAWYKGAEEWRENNEKGTAVLIPIHKAWELYEPVGILSGETRLDFPAEEVVFAAYESQLKSLMDKEINQKLDLLNKKLAKADKNYRTIKIGILYTKYGYLDKAIQELKKIESDFTAKLCLGNVYYKQKNFKQAMEYYSAAYKMNPINGILLIKMAKTYKELKDITSLKKVYNELKAIYPLIAAKYAYLVSE